MKGTVGTVIGAVACAAWLLAAGLVDVSAQQAGAQQPAAGQGQRQGGPGGGRAGGGGGRGQGRGGGQAQTPQAAAPLDLTGYWVAVITEDWRFRMVTPPIGDTASLPLNQAGTQAANAWDMQKDIAAGEQCKPFGAGGVMNMPIRLHITWQDANTLKMDIDNGTQTRLFHFDQNAQPPAQPEWQGFSLANWETTADGQGQAGGGGRGGAPTLSGGLKVVTTRMRPGYIRRNGVPYSGNAVLTEFYDRTEEPNGDSWLILTSSLDDPMYLQVPYFVTRHYKREADGAKFQPRPCEMTPPVDGTGDGRP
jgi:hypothetical protein